MSRLAAEEAYGAPSADELAPIDVGDVRPVPRISIQAFCESGRLATAIEEAATDRRLARTHVKVQMGGLAAAAEFYAAAPTPNLIVAETSLSGERLLSELDALAEVCDAGTKVVVIGHVNDVELYRRLVRRGVSEYLVLPVDKPRFIKAVAELYVDPNARPLGRAIAFVGAKGGSGSSMVAHNVAWSIARSLKNDVVLADLDVAFGTAGLDFNQDPAQGIADAINSPERVDDNYLDRLLARCADNLNLLAAPATLDRVCDFSEAAFENIIEVAQTGAPSLILDVPHVWTGWARKTLFAADEIVLTAEPDLASLRNAKNLIDLFKMVRLNDSPVRLVINKAGVPKRPEIKIADFVAAVGLDPVAVLPFEPQLFGTAANNGQMIAEIDAKSPIAAAFNEIAQIVMGKGEIKHKKRSGKSLSPFFAKLRKPKAGAG